MRIEPRESEKNLRVVVVAADEVLAEEFRSALAFVPDRQGVVYHVSEHRDAVETARRRQPHLIVIAIERDPSDIASLAKELQAEVPESAIAGAFMPDYFGQGQSEGAVIIELLRAQVRDFLRRPVAATELRTVLDRLFTRTAGHVPAAAGRVTTFLSNKGGVGKSTLAVNAACGLALRHPDEVVLIDASLQLGDCAMLLDVQPTTTIVDAVRERDRLDRTLLRHLTLRHGSGLRVLAAPADALEGSEIDDEAIARIVNMARRSFKYVIVDTSPMLDSVLMALLDASDAAFVVIQGLAPAVAGAARLLPVLEGLGISAARQRLVLNYNYKSFLGNLKPSDIADRLQRTVDYVMPYEPRVLASVNTGRPQVLYSRPWHRFGRSVNQLVADLDGWTGSVARVELSPVIGDRQLKALD